MGGYWVLTVGFGWLRVGMGGYYRYGWLWETLLAYPLTSWDSLGLLIDPLGPCGAQVLPRYHPISIKVLPKFCPSIIQNCPSNGQVVP